MRKIFIVLIVGLILLSNKFSINFSLTNYFDGEFLFYSSQGVNDDSVFLGFCFENKTKVANVIGESLKTDLEPIEILTKLNAKVVKTEIIDSKIIIYAYSNLINKNLILENKTFNLQIAYDYEKTIVGWPIIYGSF